MSDETVDEERTATEGAVATEAPPEEDSTSTELAETDDHAPPALSAGPATADPVRDRFLLPILLPIVSILAVLVLVLNFSRVLLASGEDGSVLTGSIITVLILGGAAAISASPRLRTSSLALIVAGFVVVVVGSGLITLGPSEDHGEGEATGFQEPAGPPVATLSVDALQGQQFQSDSFTVSPAGITEVIYNDRGGTHTLLFTDPKFAGFKLAVPNGPAKLKVELEPGTYTIYCDIAGHRAAGMEAEVNVVEGAGT